MDTIPDGILDRLTGIQGAELTECTATDFEQSMGVATDCVARLSGVYRAGGVEGTFTVIRKRFRPLTEGRHATAARQPNHWAYWRRELNAYASGLLPSGPDLRAPTLLGVDGDTIYLEDVDGVPESPTVAARRLARWQSSAKIPDVPWLAGHQLAQRLAVGDDLDWSTVDADARMPLLWARREELISTLTDVPEVLTHGDFHLENLLSTGEGDTVVFDWCTFGVAPLGADLAQLMLSTRQDLLSAYLDGLGGRFAEADVRTGLSVVLSLTGASRVHWMLSRGVPVPTGYEDLVASFAS